MDELGLSRPGGPCDPNADFPIGPIEEKIHILLEDNGVHQDIYDAVDEIVHKLEADNARLREVLKPLCDVKLPDEPHYVAWTLIVMVSDLANAQAALKEAS